MNTQNNLFTTSLQNSLMLIKNALEFAQSKGIFKLKDAAEITSALIDVDIAMESILKSVETHEGNTEEQNSILKEDIVQRPQPTRRKNG